MIWALAKAGCGVHREKGGVDALFARKREADQGGNNCYDTEAVGMQLR